MGERNRVTVRMQFNDGSKIDSWLSLSLRDTYTDPLGQLDFVTAPPRAKIAEYRERLQKGELVTVLANDVNQGTFLITTRRMSISKDGGVVFALTCKSPLVTAYEGSADPKFNFASQTDTALGEVILKALLPYGFDALNASAKANVSALTGKAIGGAGGTIATSALKTREAQAQEGEKAYELCSRLLSRRAVALRCNADGSLLLTTPNYDQEVAYSLVQDFDGFATGDRFFGTIQIEDTNDDQYSECRVRGLADDERGDTETAQPEAVVLSSDINPTRPPYSAGAGAAYKRLEILDKEARDRSTCESVGRLALGFRARTAFTVTGTVDGFVSSTGRFWQVDTLVRVVVQADAIDEDMWILERVFEQDVEQGQRTRLTLIPKGSLVLGKAPE